MNYLLVRNKLVLSGHVVIIYTEANLDNETGKPNFSSEENAFVKFQKYVAF